MHINIQNKINKNLVSFIYIIFMQILFQIIKTLYHLKCNFMNFINLRKQNCKKSL